MFSVKVGELQIIHRAPSWMVNGDKYLKPTRLLIKREVA